MEKKFFRSGFVALVGRPNVGKSTLMNQLIGEKIAIISPKPQTTRNRIQTILTKENFQAIFIDTPGIHKSKHKLGDYMVKAAVTALNEVDVVLMLAEPDERGAEADRFVLEYLTGIQTPVILVLNKIDTEEKSSILARTKEYSARYPFREIVPLSAKTGENCDTLLSVLYQYLPEGPMYFPEDMVTDQPERQIAAEIIREKALQLLQDEIPHGIAVTVESFKERPDKDLVDISVEIYCERKSHKGMIIGKGGQMLKKIASAARTDCEELLGTKVNLQCWVKIREDWRDNERQLDNLGFAKP